MKALITGMNGTVAPATAKRLREAGVDCVPWDRNRFSPDHHDAVRAHLREVRPDWMLHIGMGSPDWAAVLADESRALGSRFLFTGTVSVFDNRNPGPYAPDRKPDAQDDYGRYKAECERKIKAANPDAIIARLGWQIGHAPGNNNMVDFLVRTGTEKGKVELSGGVIHSHAFLEDTADALYRLLKNHPAGLYQLEGNPGLSMAEVARRLAKIHNFPFPIVEIQEAKRDVRMVNDKIEVGQITARLQR